MYIAIGDNMFAYMLNVGFVMDGLFAIEGIRTTNGGLWPQHVEKHHHFQEKNGMGPSEHVWVGCVKFVDNLSP